MSGSPAGSNVVPLPTASPASPYWPMPQVMPGCCPPGGMDALMKCYCDIQSATAFICAVMVDCINTNPAVIQAILDAIAKSGSNVPLVGVTNGTEAQAGQVGERILLTASFPVVAGNSQPVLVLGTLPPGDWDCWYHFQPNANVAWVAAYLAPQPAGFDDNMTFYVANATENELFPGPGTRALTSVPSLLAFQFQISSTETGDKTGDITFFARRRR